MRAAIILGFVAAGGGVAFSACSLGLDESKINAQDASTGDNFVPLGDSAVPDGSNPVQCNADPDCKPGNACLTGKCDTTKHQCSYTICPTQAACQASVCDNSSKTCSVPTSYKFHAGNFHVSTGDIGCGGSAGRCFAAVYPFVFIGTTNGVVARTVADPTDGTTAEIPVGGLPFLPSQIVAAGSRVYFLGNVSGNGPAYKVPLAWLDVPTDPTVSAISATSVFDTVSVSSIAVAWPDTQGGIYLVNGDGNKAYPSAHVTTPLKDLDTLSFFPLAGIPQNHGPVGASGTRIITFLNFGNYQESFSLENAAATGGAQNGGAQEITSSLGNISGPFYAAQGSDGSFAWAANGINAPDGGSPTVIAARVGWVLADQNATSFDGTKHVDVEAYSKPVGPGGDYPGPIAWFDATHLLVVSAPDANMQQAVVKVATTDPSPAMMPNKSFTLAFHPSQLGAVASNGFGYVLTPDQTAGSNVHVFALGCDN